MNIKKRIIYPAILSGISILFFVLTISWILKDRGGTFISDAAHLFNASSHCQSLRSIDIPSFMLVRELYPNLFHQLTAMLSLVTGDITLSSALLNTSFIVLLMFGTYFLVSRLWNRDAGLIAAILPPGFVGITHYSLINNIDIALAAAIVWAMYLLILSDNFKSGKYAILFFIACGVGMIIKWAFVFFMIVPFLIVLVSTIRKTDDDTGTGKKDFLWLFAPLISYFILFGIVFLLGKDDLGYPPPDTFWIFYIIVTVAGIIALILFSLKSRLRGTPQGNLLSGSILFMVITNHFYLFSFQFLLKTYMGRFWGGSEIQKHASTRSVYHFLVKFFAIDYVGIPILIFIIIGIVYYLIRGNRTGDKNLLLWSSLSAMLIFALQPIYDTRYFIPLTGLLSGFAVFWIFSIKSKALRTIILLPLLAISFLTWSGWIILPESVENIFPGIKIARPSDEDWKTGEIINTAINDFRENYKPGESGLFVVYNRCDAAGMKPLVLMYHFSTGLSPGEKIYIFPEDINLRENIGESSVMYYIAPVRDDIGRESKPTDEIVEVEDGAGADMDITWESVSPDVIYMILLTTGKSPDKTPDSLTGYMKDNWIKKGKNMVPIAEFHLPGGNSAYIYRKKMSP
ncbi:MAG: glycosyltransferase family 39 protein [Candidatus Eremiobacteraeota bacterium]|nr:glycosyltransferase family 39 protein [Candidatus Eremiobacteraeota bacterium]